LNLSSVKSQKIEKSQKNVTIVIPNENNLLSDNFNNNQNYNLNIDNQIDPMPIRKRLKLTNLKTGSIYKNSNLFLTKVEDMKQTENFFNLETNNLSANNKADDTENKRGSEIIINFFEEDPNNLSLKAKEGKGSKRPQGVLFELKEENENNKNFQKRKSDKENRINHNNDNYSKSTAVNGTTVNDSDLKELNDFEDNKNSLKKKKKKNDHDKRIKEKDNYYSVCDNDNEEKINKQPKLKFKEEQFNFINNFESKKNLIHLSFSDSESNSSFIYLNPMDKNKNKNNLLLKGKLPPLKISNLETQYNQIRTIDYKMRSSNFTENKNNNTTLNKINKENSDNYYAINSENLNKEIFSPQFNTTTNKKKLLRPSNQTNIYNLKLPKLALPQKNKSHLDILSTITKELKTVGHQNSKEINITNYNNYNKRIFPEVKSIMQSFTLQDEKFMNDPENEFYNTQEFQLKLLNTRRIKQKVLPLDLDKPKHNNNKQGLKSQLFLKNFFSKCKSHQANISSIISEISSNVLNNSNNLIKNDPIQSGRKTKLELQSEEIDKEIFHLDYPEGIREKAVSLKGAPMQPNNKYSSENKNSPLVIGEVIAKMDESFGVRCKEVVESRFIMFDHVTQKRLKIAKEKKELDLHIGKISGLHAQIEKVCEKIEKVKFSALKKKI
jgi:hypothetical protein